MNSRNVWHGTVTHHAFAVERQNIKTSKHQQQKIHKNLNKKKIKNSPNGVAKLVSNIRATFCPPLERKTVTTLRYTKTNGKNTKREKHFSHQQSYTDTMSKPATLNTRTIRTSRAHNFELEPHTHAGVKTKPKTPLTTNLRRLRRKTVHQNFYKNFKDDTTDISHLFSKNFKYTFFF